MDCARDNPSVSAADCAPGSLDMESPYPVTLMVPLPRLAANALTSSLAGCDRLVVCSENTIVADVLAAGGGIGAGTTAAAGAAPAIPGRGGAPSGNAGNGPDAAPFGLGAPSERAATAGGASSGALCTAFRGAGAGGGGVQQPATARPSAVVAQPVRAARSPPAAKRLQPTSPERQPAAAAAPFQPQTDLARRTATMGQPKVRTAPRAARWSGPPPARPSASATPPRPAPRALPEQCSGSGTAGRRRAGQGAVRRSSRPPADATS